MTDPAGDICNIQLPFNKTADLKNVEYEGGMDMLRILFREGRRFTTIDLDRDSAQKLAKELTTWAEKQA